MSHDPVSPRERMNEVCDVSEEGEEDVWDRTMEPFDPGNEGEESGDAMTVVGVNEE